MNLNLTWTRNSLLPLIRVQRFLSWRPTSRQRFSRKNQSSHLFRGLWAYPVQKGRGKKRDKRGEKKRNTRLSANLVGTANALVAFTNATISPGEGGSCSQSRVPTVCPRFKQLPYFVSLYIRCRGKRFPSFENFANAPDASRRQSRATFVLYLRYLATPLRGSNPSPLCFPNTGPEITGVTWNSSSFNSSNDRYIDSRLSRAEIFP